MFQSKALKNFSDKKRSKLSNWWRESSLSDYYYDFIHKYIDNPIFQVKRLYQWYMNVFRYDFDGHCLYAIIEYKLKRVEKSLHKGHAIQEPKDMKALKLAVKLAGRLKDDKYDMVVYDRMEKKWGEFKTWTTPCEGRKGYNTWHSKYEKVNNKKDEKKSFEERQGLYAASHAKMKRDEKNLYAILYEYLRKWWD